MCELGDPMSAEDYMKDNWNGEWSYWKRPDSWGQAWPDVNSLLFDRGYGLYMFSGKGLESLNGDPLTKRELLRIKTDTGKEWTPGKRFEPDVYEIDFTLVNSVSFANNDDDKKNGFVRLTDLVATNGDSLTDVVNS